MKPGVRVLPPPSITFTFSDATNFNCVSDVYGSLGSGTVSGSFQPNNSVTGTPYLTIPAAAWGGTFANGDTVVCDMIPMMVPLWEDGSMATK